MQCNIYLVIFNEGERDGKKEITLSTEILFETKFNLKTNRFVLFHDCMKATEIY